LKITAQFFGGLHMYILFSNYGKVMHYFWKNMLGYSLGDIFIKSSGRTFFIFSLRENLSWNRWNKGVPSCQFLTCPTWHT
jgi:hypothetical protein